MGKAGKNRHAQYLLEVGTWANTHPPFLDLLPLSYKTSSRLELLAMLQNQFPSSSADPMKLLSDLISLANTSWNHPPHLTNFAPLHRAIQACQQHKEQHRQTRGLLVYNLYLSLSPKKRDQEYLAAIPTIQLPRLSKSEIYPPSNHWIYETEQIRHLWEHHLISGKQPDSRLKRHPLLMLEPSLLKLDISGSQSAIIQDKDSGEIVAMVYRNFMPTKYESILEWINDIINTSIGRKRSARLEDPGTIVQAGYSAGSRSQPRFNWVKNLVSKSTNRGGDEEIEYMESSVFALFWNMARRIVHGDISNDIEKFLEEGYARMDSRGRQRGDNTYAVKYEGEMYELGLGELAPPVGFFASNYSRAIHKETGPHKYSLFWTTERTLGEDEGGNFLISDYGIRIQGAKNTIVAWQAKMFHGTSLAKLESIDSHQGRGQTGLSIVTPNRLPAMWKRYMDERIDAKILEEELNNGEEQWE